MSMLPLICHGYTFHSSCGDFRQQQINQGFTEMRNMAGIAADDIGTDQSPRVRQLLKALIGDADQNQLIGMI